MQIYKWSYACRYNYINNWDYVGLAKAMDNANDHVIATRVSCYAKLKSTLINLSQPKSSRWWCAVIESCDHLTVLLGKQYKVEKVSAGYKLGVIFQWQLLSTCNRRHSFAYNLALPYCAACAKARDFMSRWKALMNTSSNYGHTGNDSDAGFIYHILMSDIFKPLLSDHLSLKCARFALGISESTNDDRHILYRWRQRKSWQKLSAVLTTTLTSKTISICIPYSSQAKQNSLCLLGLLTITRHKFCIARLLWSSFQNTLMRKDCHFAMAMLHFEEFLERHRYWAFRSQLRNFSIDIVTAVQSIPNFSFLGQNLASKLLRFAGWSS